MAQLKPTKTVYTVSQFLEWQRSGLLRLKPVFQRREVWGPKAKSFLIDTITRGLPVPIVFVRQVQDLEKLSSIMEVVDGQQRLRTIISFVQPSALKDFDPAKDAFTVRKTHNPALAGKSFTSLSADVKADILNYEISTHVLPPNTGDDMVLRIFSRLNSTGAKLNHQELRNAQYYGEFKTLAYELAFENLQRWRDWGIFSDPEIGRMTEVESVSEYLLVIVRGIEAKSQLALDKAYDTYDDTLDGGDIIKDRFQKVLDALEDTFGKTLSSTRLKRPALFYSLFTATYDHMYGLGTPYTRSKKPKTLPSGAQASLQDLDRKIAKRSLPEKVQDAMDRGTADKSTRQTRHKYFLGALGLVSAS